VVYLVRPQSIEKLERSLGTAQSAFKMELGPQKTDLERMSKKSTVRLSQNMPLDGERQHRG
jgi:hypothetical protein